MKLGCSSARCLSPTCNLPIMQLLIRISTILSYITISYAFQSAAWAPSVGMQASIICSRRGHQPLLAKGMCENEQKQGCINWSGDNINSVTSKLFPHRKQTRSTHGMQLMMTTDNGADGESSNKVSDKSSPLAKVWLSFRKLLARLWTLFLKPFQLLKSFITKIKGKENTDDDEPVQEEVAITEVENIAAVEQEEEQSVEVDSTVDNADEKQTAAESVIEPVVEHEVVSVAPPPSAAPQTKTDATTTPRKATSSNVDLTGNWTLLVDDHFTSQYDEYLRKLGQPMLVRTVAMTVIGSTKEETIQSDGGQQLYIRGSNVRGSWDRTLEASEQIVDADLLQKKEKHAVEGHELRPMTTADGENVEVASWWEDNGAVHHSWVVGGKKYGGGDFENKRYLTDNGNILVCESTFHPKEEGRETASVSWRFLREGAIYGDKPIHFPNVLDMVPDILKKDDKVKGKDDLPESGVLVGDIMDSVATSEEAKELSTIDNSNKDAADIDMIEEAIEEASWQPPVGDRWAISALNVDLSGKWKLIITEQFKKEYDAFLRSLGQPLIVRAAAVVLIGNTREQTQQTDGGRTLYIKGVNAKGIWERTLTATGSDADTTILPKDGKYEHTRAPILTADSELVDAESWWEKDGYVHVSWTYGGKRYGGGDFESRRYLENDGDVYVCETTFHPTDGEREKSYLKWKFLREGSAISLTEK